MLHELSVARDFSRTPGPRYVKQGDASGELFRVKVVELLRGTDGKVTVDLDGTAGYGSSFIDECFGGLVRTEGFTAKDLEARLSIICTEDESYVEEAWDSIRKAKPESIRR